ncbi:MAG: glycosyltransferase family 2 protein [Candidatus Diapherotrites archaeon]|uniref:Glycosyltransferase family 2 protein n=1 Tax=Candidatus Iainarchaeum sp. TaxID=3101447 RepID=A0A7J4JXG2_9ARCH|nr:glycosyltransferase family 2 protein [Candidatus Diapherotrites archaeon]HIH21690.1 glycosyltransferase family 2 protein [Candidatus Diapherotrites archaeon]HIH33516.1 glycosyltransferase family 2 protein [Candidatus Diapherotrites archaeon]
MSKKLVVMIPAFNEEKTIASVIREIPRKIAGISKVEVLVIDDGSTDNTARVARKAGADEIFSHRKNFGLAVAFRHGLEQALGMKADIIVNTDADFQYNQKEIPKIIKPILEGKADIVLTDRNVWSLRHMPLGKKLGNLLSTAITRFVSGFPTRDAQSGFRAFSKEAALQLNILSRYTYVQETIIQAFNKNLAMLQVPCEFRKREGKSRLISSLWKYARNAGIIIIRNYVQYRPLKAFLEIGGFVMLIGFILGLRVLIHYLLTGMVSPFIPTAILTAILLMIGFQIIVLGLIADAIKAQRQVQEELLYYRKKERFDR